MHGCSAFEQDFPICTEFDTTGTIDPEGNVHGEDGDNVQHLRVCKETCRVDGCNDYVLDVPEPNNNLCYQCFAIYDNIGNMLTGDPGCYDPADTDNIDERYLKTCPGEEQHCVIEMEVDWLLGDTQKGKKRKNRLKIRPGYLTTKQFSAIAQRSKSRTLRKISY